jgi:signal transduction histidine kinase
MGDGLQGFEFSPGAAHLGRSGTMYFGGLKGFNLFHPGEIADNPHPPEVLLSRIKLGGDAIPLGDRRECPRISLDYPQRDFSVFSTVLEYTDPGRNKLVYMLRGFDASWVDGDPRREATYTNIPPGKYVFAVRASNADGIWSENETRLEIDVLPAYWETLWFKTSILVAVAGFLVFLYRLRISKLLFMERMRIRIASDLHDDIGSTLTKVAVHSEVIQRTDSVEAIRETSRKIGIASRELITTLSDIVWSIDARNDRIGDLLDRMRDFVSEVLSAKHIEHQFIVDGMDAARTLPAELRQNLYLIFKEAVTNITRHSKAQYVSIELKNGPHQFTMRISNDGEEQDPENRRTGHYGMKNMSLRARQIGADLKVEGPPGFAIILRRKRI